MKRNLPRRRVAGDANSAHDFNTMVDAQVAAFPASVPGMRISAFHGGVVASPVRRRFVPPFVAARIQFRARMDQENVQVWKGYRQRIGSNPVLLAPVSGNEFTFAHVDGNAIWTVFTYRTTESGTGTWDAALQTGATIPDDNQNQRVIIIARMVTVDGVRDVLQEHSGPIAVYDILNRSACE